MAKYNSKTVENICEKLRNGNTQKDAAILSGVEERTFYRWLNSKSQFRQSVERAISEYREKLINIVNVGSIKSPGLALEVLARRWPDDWGELKKLQINDSQQTLERMFRLLLGKPVEGDIIKDVKSNNRERVPELTEGDAAGSSEEQVQDTN